VACGKHTMVRLQISMHTSKQRYQSFSRNAATVYHRLPNERALDKAALHGATQALQRMPPGSQKSDLGNQSRPK
jgi:hypothetical protein